MEIILQIKKLIENEENTVFLVNDFANLNASEKEILSALDLLVQKKKLLNIYKNVYVKAKESLINGELIPLDGLNTLKEAVQRLGFTLKENPALTSYNTQQSKQVPTGRVISVLEPTPDSLKFAFNGIEVYLSAN